MPEHEQAADGYGFWVRSDLTAGGSYVATVSYGADVVFTLDPAGAQRYAAAAVTAAEYAEFDAALIGLLAHAGGPARMSPLDAAAFVAGELRPGRPEVDSAAFGPLDYRPSATVAGKPFVTVAVHGEAVAQLSPRQLREHATGVLSAAVAAQLDQQLKDVMLSIAGLPDYAAARLVGELLPWRDRASELAEE